MGTIIEHVSVSTHGWRTGHSALRLAVRAARDCLRTAGCPPSELDLLVNAGVYRDRNLGEPALAALIQEDIGANPEDPHPDKHGTFSFDLANGVAGVLSALQVVDGFLRSGAVHRALVVASDADPGRGLAEQFPFAAAGSALLCRWADDDTGLGPVSWVNAPDGGASFRSTVGLHDGHNMLRVQVSESLDEQLAAVAARAVGECGVDVAAVDVIVAAPARPAFAKDLAAQLNVDPNRLVLASDDRMHTASLPAALSQAMADGRLPAGGTALLVAAGAGVTAGAARYRAPRK